MLIAARHSKQIIPFVGVNLSANYMIIHWSLVRCIRSGIRLIIIVLSSLPNGRFILWGLQNNVK